MNDVSRSSQTSQDINNEKQLGHSAEKDAGNQPTKFCPSCGVRKIGWSGEMCFRCSILPPGGSDA